jgi:plastocyanin
MKAIMFFLVMLLAVCSLHAQTTHTVQQSGFAYNPATLAIVAGESVKFEGSSSHPILEVSETTWNNNGITALEGGFSLPSGSGTVNFPEAGTHYYVCTAHVASEGMKGKIIVQVASGLDDNVSSDRFSVYPLPLTGNLLTLAVQSADLDPITVEIYDLAGNLRVSSHGTVMGENYRIDCSSLPRGVFYMTARVGKEEYVSKVVKL